MMETEEDKASSSPPSSSSNTTIMTKLQTCCCSWYDFDGEDTAKGFCLLGIGRGAVIMSNIFLSTSFIYLASVDAGCQMDDGDGGEGNNDNGCNNNVYGMTPASLIANIAIVSGLLSAFLMPIAGAMIDLTPYRRETGILSAFFMIFIQAIQIGTVQSTWFPMAILQAIAGFLYQVQVLATFAYLPEIARSVGQTKLTYFQSTFTIAQFTSQALYLVVAIAIGSVLSLNDVQMGMLGQALDTVWSGLTFALGWKLLKPTPAANTLSSDNNSTRRGNNMLCYSFSQVWQTTKKIYTTFGQSLRYFFLAVVFSEAAANAFTTLSVVFLKDQLNLSGSQVGIFFLCSLIGTIPGAKMASWVTIRLTPPISWSLSMAFILVVSTAGALTLNEGMNVFITYIWGFLIGVGLGWFYPCERLCFAMLLPQGQEAELSGFNVYCTQILVWLPPLVFSILVQSNVHQKYGLLSIQCFFLVGIAFLLMIRWDAALLQVHGSIPDDCSKSIKTNDKTYNAPQVDESGDVQAL